jgi:peptidoglycan/xylan/chitin deacetylase (PgdA/CDA1 family)
MRKFFQTILPFIICFALMGAVGYWLFYDKYTVPIMMYHSVSENPPPQTASIKPDRFREHMEYLEKYHYNVITLAELVKGIKEDRVFPHDTVVITFDDGYRDNYTTAVPILREHSYTATFFVPTAKIDTPGRLTWDDAKDMLLTGMQFGSHGHRELYLPEVSQEDQRSEIYDSKKLFKDRLNMDAQFYSYPVGGFSQAIKDMLKKAGYIAACATNRGTDRYNHDVYELNRIRFGDKDDSEFILWAKLSGFYNIFRSLRNSE